MLNVNIAEQELKKQGYIFEHGKNMLIIRDFGTNPLVEITYFEENGEILLNTEKEYHWCNEIKTVFESHKGNKLNIIAKKEGKAFYVAVPVEKL